MMEQKKALNHGSSFIIVKCANCKRSDRNKNPKKEDRNHEQVNQRSNERMNEQANANTQIHRF